MFCFIPQKCAPYWSATEIFVLVFYHHCMYLLAALLQQQIVASSKGCIVLLRFPAVPQRPLHVQIGHRHAGRYRPVFVAVPESACAAAAGAVHAVSKRAVRRLEAEDILVVCSGGIGRRERCFCGIVRFSAGLFYDGAARRIVFSGFGYDDFVGGRLAVRIQILLGVFRFPVFGALQPAGKEPRLASANTPFSNRSCLAYTRSCVIPSVSTNA